MKGRMTMPKYYTYEGKQVGFVRKALGDVVMVEDAWVNEIRGYLAKNGYDALLKVVAQILQTGGHPPVTRAQAWIILRELLQDEIPTVLQNREADEVSSKGNLFASIAKTSASAVDTVTAPVGKVVGGSIAAVGKINPIKKPSAEPTEPVEGDESAE